LVRNKISGFPLALSECDKGESAWLLEPTGISERLTSYLPTFSMAILISLLLPEKDKS